MTPLKRFNVSPPFGLRLLFSEIEIEPLSTQAIAAYIKLKFPALALIRTQKTIRVAFKPEESKPAIGLGDIPGEVVTTLSEADISSIKVCATAINKRGDGTYCVQLSLFGTPTTYDSLFGMPPAEQISKPEAMPKAVTKIERTTTPQNLRPCEDCGHPVSIRAESCPHCGCPIVGARTQSAIGTTVVTTQGTAKKLKAHKVASIALLLLSILMLITTDHSDPDNNTPLWAGLLILSIGWYYISRLRIWWNHS